jgi:uncharacterized surface protein with fasciclin (FAS1) repeats
MKGQAKYKVVFQNGASEKLIFGYSDFETDDNTLLKIKTDKGNIFYVNKSSIIFMKELKGGHEGGMMNEQEKRVV